MMSKRMKNLMRNCRRRMKKNMKTILRMKSFDHYNYKMNNC